VDNGTPKPFIASAALVAVAFWSLKPILVATIGDRATYLEVFLTAATIAVAAGAAGALAMWPKTRALVRARPVAGLRDAAVSGFFLAVWYYCFYRALYNSQKVDATIIAFTWPLIAIFAMRAILPEHGRRLTLVELSLVLIAFLGAITIGLSRLRITEIGADYEIAFAFLAALASGLYLPFSVRSIQAFTPALGSSVAATFYMVTASNAVSLACILLWIGVSREQLYFYAFDAEVWLICAAIGIGTYLLAEMTWAWALSEYDSPTLSSLAYFSPAFSVVLLFAFFDVPVTHLSAYGLLLILFSNMSLHSKYTASNAIVSALIGTLYVALCSVFVQPVDEPFLTDLLYFVSGLFAILSGFILSRVSSRRSQELGERTAVTRAFLDLRGADGAGTGRGGEGRAPADDTADALLRAMVDIEFGRGAPAKYEAARRLRALLRGCGIEGAARACDRFDAWFSTHIDHLSLGEKAALWITGGSSIMFFMLARGEGVLSDIGLFAFTAGCLLVIFTIFDYERNNLQGFRNEMDRVQEGFRELGRAPYVPSELAVTQEVRMLRDAPLVRFVSRDGRLVSREMGASRSTGFAILYWITALLLVASLLFMPLSATDPDRTQIARILRPDAEFASSTVLLERPADLTIGRFDWDASHVAAEIIAQVVEARLGLRAVTAEVGLDEVFQQMAAEDGGVDVHPDFWSQNQPQNFRRYVLQEGSVRLNESPYFGWQGIYAPSAAAEALSLAAVEDLTAPEVVAAFDEDGDGRGEIWVGARNWKSTARTRAFLARRGLDRLWEAQVYSDTIFKAKLRRFMSQGRPILFYGYEPDWIHAAYELRRLDEGPGARDGAAPEGDCLPELARARDPQGCVFPPVAVHVAFAARLEGEHPEAAEMLGRISFRRHDVSGWLARMGDRSAPPDEIARDWIAANGARIAAWAAPDG
jgi:glycine betaine/proline transport system substrate-binding protein